MTHEEIKKVLEKQLQLLSERSNEAGVTSGMLIDLSRTMCEIAKTINSISFLNLEH
ncbi:MAG: hypothetical protein ACYCWE_21085 [Eubacteriales bacterium]